MADIDGRKTAPKLSIPARIGEVMYPARRDLARHAYDLTSGETTHDTGIGIARCNNVSMRSVRLYFSNWDDHPVNILDDCSDAIPRKRDKDIILPGVLNCHPETTSKHDRGRRMNRKNFMAPAHDTRTAETL